MGTIVDFVGSDESPGNELARELRLLKDRAGLSLNSLATRCWCSRSSLERYLNGKVFPSRDMVKAISDACGGDTAAVLALWELAWGARGGKRQGPASDTIADSRRPHRSIRTRRCDLPRDVSHFTGRTEEILRVLEAPDVTGSTGVLVAIDGMAGVGKTTLAVHAARRLVDRYPDAQLFVDLHAHTPGQRALTPATALDRLLRAVNVPGEHIPDDLEERAAFWRARLADHRALIVLDNAVDSSQILPLLPGSPNCLVLVTSRRRLLGLDGTHLVSLDVMPAPDAASLFAQVVGDARPARESAAAAEIVKLCGFLPLAVGIAAARLRHRPMWTVEQLADRLRNRQRRLAELHADGRDVQAVFSLSYHHLSPDQQRLFRLTGLHPGADIDSHAAAALADLPVHRAERLLEDLVDAHLLQQPGPGRYRFHALMRQFAADRSRHEDDAATVTASKRRMLDWYLHSTAAAARRLNPNRSLDPVRQPPEDVQPPTFTSDQQALDWLDAQYDCLVAACRLAAEERMTRLAWLLPWILSHYRHHVQGQSAEAIECFETALALCRETADYEGQAHMLSSLGVQYALRAKHGKAIEVYQQAIAVSHETGNRSSEANSLINLAISYVHAGRPDDAVHCAEQAVDVAVSTGSRAHEGAASRALGKAHLASYRFREAFTCLRRALVIGEELNYAALQTTTLLDIGRAHRELGEPTEAITAYERALRISRGYGSRSDEGAVLTDLGDLYGACGDPDRARDCWQRALALLTRFGYPAVEQLRTKLATQ